MIFHVAVFLCDLLKCCILQLKWPASVSSLLLGLKSPRKCARNSPGLKTSVMVCRHLAYVQREALNRYHAMFAVTILVNIKMKVDNFDEIEKMLILFRRYGRIGTPKLSPARCPFLVSFVPAWQRTSYQSLSPLFSTFRALFIGNIEYETSI